VKPTGILCQDYFICLDADFGALFIKFCSYLPYNTRCPFNANHWARQQAAKAGIGFAR
jgi:hypothetical protein